MQRIITIPAFRDNYIWLLLRDGAEGALVVDPGEAEPVERALRACGAPLAGILLTHHHPDHVGGVDALLARWDVPVYGPRNPAIRSVRQRLGEGDRVRWPGGDFRVLETPGHTMDHIAYYSEAPGRAPMLFCGDTLFTGGCGRLFEGDAATMRRSLDKLRALAPETEVYCGHEYTEANLRFAREVEPDNAALSARCLAVARRRKDGQATVPSRLADELATNPFLRCDAESLRRSATRRLGRKPADADEVFATIRAWKDGY